MSSSSRTSGCSMVTGAEPFAAATNACSSRYTKCGAYWPGRNYDLDGVVGALTIVILP